jgi:hypothetical protein
MLEGTGHLWWVDPSLVSVLAPRIRCRVPSDPRDSDNPAVRILLGNGIPIRFSHASVARAAEHFGPRGIIQLAFRGEFD